MPMLDLFLDNRRIISTALDYLTERGYPANPDLIAKIRLDSYKQFPSYRSVVSKFWAAVYDAIYNYLTGGSVVSNRNAMKQAVAYAWNETAELAYVDGGGELPMDKETQQWVASEQAAQLDYVSNLFERLKELRKEPEINAIHEAFAIADRWANSLDGFYNSTKMAGAGNKMLTWNLGATEQHCRTCANLDGQRHRASWYRSRDYYPKKPGSATECGGYRCDCDLTDDEGNVFTL